MLQKHIKRIRCPLCQARRLTHRYFEDDFCWIADCASCKGIPMVVLKRHSMKVSLAEHERLVEALSKVADLTLGIDSYIIDTKQKKIRDHLHYHARRK